MTKFQKRILKTNKKLDNCLLIGQGFGFLHECIGIFKTVFIICDEQPEFRAKNLIFRDDTDNLNQLTDVSHIFFDRALIKNLENYQYMWNKHDSIVVIEGNDPIEREFSTSLYSTGWQCTATHGFFHIWERLK